MNVGQLCQSNVVTVREFDELPDAALLMREKHIGYLIVVEPGLEEGTFRPSGVLTDRDIVVSVVAKNANPQSLTVGDIMTRQPVVVDAEDSLSDALREMRRIGVRRMPVVGPRGELVGVLSLDDVLYGVAGELQNIAAAIRSEQVIESTLRP